MRVRWTAAGAHDASACSEHKLAELKRGWAELEQAKSPQDKLYLSRAVLQDIAKYSKHLAALLRALFLNESHYNATAAALLAVDSWSTIIRLYPDTQQLNEQIVYDAATRTEFARVYYGNAPIIAQSILK